jgi:PIN domain nuclease of toxin-antitoxin system
MARRAPLKVLLDTCAVLGLADGDLPPAAAAALRQAPEAYVSSVSAWEVAIKVKSGKLRLREDPATWFLDLLERYDLREVPLDAVVACAAADLPTVHRDPFDRVIVALAGRARLTVLTSDDNIARYPGVTTLW